MSTHKKRDVNVVQHLDAAVANTGKRVDKLIDPYRQSAFKRFPTLFTLLVTIGVAATFFGLERLMQKTPSIYEHPAITLCVGLLILIVTGRLYKKLG